LNYVNRKWLDAKNVNKAYFKHKNLNDVNPKNWNEWYENVTMRACIPRNPQKETNRQQKKEKKIIHIRLFLHKMAFIDNRPPSNIKWGGITK
jgi:hypothetical protein